VSSYISAFINTCTIFSQLDCGQEQINAESLHMYSETMNLILTDACCFFRKTLTIVTTSAHHSVWLGTFTLQILQTVL